MRIACLGWGSLIWKPGELTLASEWFGDGPSLPIEFARESDGGELATVLCPGVADVPVLWAYLDVAELAVAREQLREREGIPAFQPECVGSLPAVYGPSACSEKIATWAAAKGLDAVVWTALPPRCRGENHRMPSEKDVIEYLKGLPADQYAHAEHYIRSTPASISTANRRLIEAHFGWYPQETAA